MRRKTKSNLVNNQNGHYELRNMGPPSFEQDDLEHLNISVKIRYTDKFLFSADYIAKDPR